METPRVAVAAAPGNLRRIRRLIGQGVVRGTLRAPWLRGLGLELERLQQHPSTFGVLAYGDGYTGKYWAQPHKALEATRPGSWGADRECCQKRQR